MRNFNICFAIKKYDELSDNEKIDKVTLLLSDQFVMEGEKLFRWSIPRKKKLQAVKPLTLRLCVPRSFRHDLIKHEHDVLGHFGVTRTFQSLVNIIIFGKRCTKILRNTVLRAIYAFVRNAIMVIELQG